MAFSHHFNKERELPEQPEGGRRIELDEIDETTNVIAERIEMLSEALRRLLNGRLKEETIIVLIKESLPRGMKLEKNQIKAVLDAAMNLDNQFVRKP